MKNNQKGLPARTGNGSIVAIVIILIVLLAGAIYIWKSGETANPGNNPNNQQAVEDQLPSDESLAAQETQLRSQSDSDDLNAIERDMQATSLGGL